MLANDRVLCPRPRLPAGRPGKEGLDGGGRPTTPPATERCDPTVSSRSGRRARRHAAESEAGRICAGLGLPERVLTQRARCPAASAAGSNCRAFCSRIGNRRVRHPSYLPLFCSTTSRPPRRRLAGLAGAFPARPAPAASSSSRATSTCSPTFINRVWSSTRCAARSTSTTWAAEVPRCPRDRRTARRRERANADARPLRFVPRPPRWAQRPPKPLPPEHAAPRRPDDGRPRRGTGPPRVAGSSSRRPRHAAVPRWWPRADEELRIAGGVHRRRPRRRPGSRVVVLGLNGAGKTTLLRLLAGVETPDSGALEPGHGLKIGYFAQEHDTLDDLATVWENIRHAAPDTGEQDLRGLLGAFMFSGPQLEQPAGRYRAVRRPVWRSRASSRRRRTCCCSTSRPTTSTRRRASRSSTRSAVTSARSCWSRTTRRRRGARPQRVMLLPDGTEDFWSDDYSELSAIGDLIDLA